MVVEPAADRRDCAFVGIRGRMRAVKHLHLPKQHDCDARAFALRNLCAQINEKSFDVRPSDGPRSRAPEDGLKGLCMAPLHSGMIPKSGITSSLDPGFTEMARIREAGFWIPRTAARGFHSMPRRSNSGPALISVNIIFIIRLSVVAAV
jgi:hypothetical protein